MPKIEIRYRWKYWDEPRKKYLVTRHRCTEEMIRVEHPDAVAVEGTREELHISDEPLRATSMAHFNTGIPKKLS